MALRAAGEAAGRGRKCFIVKTVNADIFNFLIGASRKEYFITPIEFKITLVEN
jgi:hypothetical protein